MEKNVILEIKNVSKSFGRKKVIDDINLQVKEGEIYGFVGPNGAGKTTTIKMILGLLSIDKGTITINGYDIKKKFEKAMENIGGIVENPDLYGYLSGMDNLKLYAKVRNIKQERINEVVELVGLTDRIKDKVQKYSLGMKQRLGLALTLLHSPKVLILDEPTNGLDPAGIKELRDLLKDISHKQNVAVFVSSHMLAEMEQMCDVITIIDKGKIIETKDIKEVLEQKEEMTEYIMDLSPVEKALEVLGEKARLEDEKIHIKYKEEEMPKLVRKLVREKIDIYEISIKSATLEEAFFNITGGEK